MEAGLVPRNRKMRRSLNMWFCEDWERVYGASQFPVFSGSWEANNFWRRNSNDLKSRLKKPDASWIGLFLNWSRRNLTKMETEINSPRHIICFSRVRSCYSSSWLTILTPNDLSFLSYTAGTSREFVDSGFNIKSFRNRRRLNQTVLPSKVGLSSPKCKDQSTFLDSDV